MFRLDSARLSVARPQFLELKADFAEIGPPAAHTKGHLLECIESEKTNVLSFTQGPRVRSKSNGRPWSLHEQSSYLTRHMEHRT